MLPLDTLNAPQREAVLHSAGPLVVFAGAGSGKTRVITYRVANLVLAHKVPVYRILAVTFTNKAAGEMRERLEALVPGSARDLWVGTFHAICAKLLRRYAETIGVSKSFTIYDDADQRAMITRVLRDLGLDERRFVPKQVQAAIGKAKQELIQPAAYETEDAFTEVVKRIYTTYEERMRSSQALDFDDLIARMVYALEGDAAFREEMNRRFQYVLVDEFQDTNHAQSRLVNALVQSHHNLCVVGDDDQSIYRWRGADRRNILDFRRHYPDATIIKLEQNYRSTKRILRAAHAVIARNLDREPKELFTDNEEGGKVVVVRCEDERDEARLVVRAIRELGSEGYGLADMVVFYRTHAQSRVFEEAMRAANISYRVVGGQRFYDRAEIKDALAFMRAIVNPDDDVSVLRMLSRQRGVGKTTLEKLLDSAAQEGKSVSSILTRSGELLGGATAKKLEPIMLLVKELRELEASGTRIDELARMALERSGYMKQHEDDDTPEADARLENVRELLGSMQEYAEEAEEPTLSAYLELVTLQSATDTMDTEERMTLMTIHAAKGLEFPIVMVCGLEERMFPLRGGDPWEDPEEIEEERRLAYVAFTRARKRLILSHAAMRRIYGEVRIGRASRFIEDLPAEDVTRIGVSVRPAQPFQREPYREPQRAPWQHPQARASSVEKLPERAKTERYIDTSDGDGSEPSLRRGMRVRHAKFGVGEIRSVTAGMPLRVEVTFPGWGTRQIVATFLEPA